MSSSIGFYNEEQLINEKLTLEEQLKNEKTNLDEMTKNKILESELNFKNRLEEMKKQQNDAVKVKTRRDIFMSLTAWSRFVLCLEC